MTAPSVMTNEILTRLKNRKVGSDDLLEARSATKAAEDALKRTVEVSVTVVTKIEQFKKAQTADSGVEQTVARYFTERDAYLVTIKKWDTVEDKETCLRTQIVPLLSDTLKLNPKMACVFQFLDSTGQPMRHVPAPMLKAMLPGD